MLDYESMDHDLALFILSKIESEDKANKVLVLLDV